MTAKFCSKECERNGAICDSCTHFVPYINTVNQLSSNVGICKVIGEEVERSDGYNCTHYVCFKIRDKE